MGNTNHVDYIYNSFVGGEKKKSKEVLRENVLSLPPDEVNKKFEGRTLLIKFVEDVDLEMVRVLLQNSNVDVNIEFKESGKNGFLPLVHAVEIGNLELVKLLLKQPQIHVNQGCYDVLVHWGSVGNRFPLAVAIEKGNLNILKEILRHPLIDTTKLYKTRYNGTETEMNMISLAATSKSIDVLRLVTEHSEAKLLTQGYQSNPLTVAISEGSFEMVEYLVNEKEVDVSQGSQLGDPVKMSENNERIHTFLDEVVTRQLKLSRACMEENLEEVERLLSLPRTNVNKGGGFLKSPLYLACEKRNPELLELLFSHHVDLTTWEGQRGLCVLLDGEFGPLHLGMIERLLEDGTIDPFEKKRNYHNIRFESIDVLGLLCFYAKDVSFVKIFEQLLLSKSEIDLSEPLVIYKAHRGGYSWKHKIGYLPTTIVGQNLPIFEYLMAKHGEQLITNIDASGKYSPISFFLTLLSENEKISDEDETQIKMFTTLLQHEKTTLIPNEKSGDIGYSNIKDPFQYCIRYELKRYALEILKSGKFKIVEGNEEPYKSQLRDGVMRRIIRLGSLELLTHFFRLAGDVVDLSGKFGNDCLLETRDLEMKKEIFDLIIRSSGGEEKLGVNMLLYYACTASNYKKVEQLVLKDFEVKADGNEEVFLVNQRLHGMTPLFIACVHRDENLVKMLLTHPRIEVNKPSTVEEKKNEEENDEITPLMISCLHGSSNTPSMLPSNLEIVRMLLSREDIDIGFRDRRKGGSALFLSCMSAAPPKLVRALLDHPKAGSSLDINELLTVPKDDEDDFYDQTNLLASIICSETQFGPRPNYEKEESELARLIVSHPDFKVNALTGFSKVAKGVHDHISSKNEKDARCERDFES